MKCRIFLYVLLLCLLSAGCRTEPASGEETPAQVSASPAAEQEPKSAMDDERWYSAEEALKGKVYMTPPPWLPHSAG